MHKSLAQGNLGRFLVQRKGFSQVVEIVCPHEDGLECTQSERQDEFYRQMEDAMLQNKTVYFLTGGKCPVSGFTCAKLRDFRETQQKQR